MMLNRIADRILLSSAVPLTFLIVLGSWTFTTTQKAFRFEQEVKNNEKVLTAIDEAAYEISAMARHAQGAFIFPENPSYRADYDEAHDIFLEVSEDLEGLITEPEDQALLDDMVAEGNRLHDMAQEVFDLLDDGNTAAAKVRIAKLQLDQVGKDRRALIESIEADLNQSLAAFGQAEKFLLWLVGIGTILGVVTTILTSIWIGLPIKINLPKVVGAAKQIADGDLTESIESSDRTDEVGQLLTSFQGMTQSLNSLLSQVQRSGIQITTSTTQIAAAGKQLEATVTEQVASTNEAKATAHEIAQTSNDLVNTMEQVSDLAQSTAQAAGDSQADLAQMESAMQELVQSTGTISAKLGMMSEKAHNINNVVTTITKVADQTNLLSLNAAIEAEKAGEYGAGFAVVAREIRRLADQTAVATLEIEQMVKEMQSSVSTGVMEMDKFNAEVSRNVQDVGKISGQVAQMIEDVQGLTPQFDAVSQRMEDQSQGAEQISVAISQLSEASQQTVESLQDTNSALAQLNDAAQGLQQEVGMFKV